MREAAGLTQEALSERCRAARASISQARISEYEQGDKFPSPKNVEALAAALDVGPEQLYAALLAQRTARLAEGEGQLRLPIKYAPKAKPIPAAPAAEGAGAK